MTAAQFRSSPAWKRARARAIRGAVRCELCGGMLVPGAMPRTRWSATVDHVVPLSRLALDTAEGRRAAIDPGNLRVAHYGCNSRRGAGRRRGPAARDWTGPSRMPGLPAQRLFSSEETPQVWSVAEAVERLRGTDDDEFAGIDEPLRV